MWLEHAHKRRWNTSSESSGLSPPPTTGHHCPRRWAPTLTPDLSGLSEHRFESRPWSRPSTLHGFTKLAVVTYLSMMDRRVVVAARVRPMLAREIREGGGDNRPCVIVDPQVVGSRSPVIECFLLSAFGLWSRVFPGSGGLRRALRAFIRMLCRPRRSFAVPSFVCA